MIGTLVNWMRRKASEQRVGLEQTRLIESLLQRPAFFDPQQLYLDLDLSRLGAVRGKRDGRGLYGATLAHARDQSRRLCKANAHARNILAQIVNYTVGAGFSVSFDDEALDARWRKVAKIIKWPQRRRQIVRGIVRDGETLLRRFSPDPATLRFVPPEHLAPMQGDADLTEDGVVTEDDDVEQVLGYVIDDEVVEAKEVRHYKPPDTDADETRGWPMMFDAAPVIVGYEQWISDRHTLNRIRASIALLRKRKNATQADLERIQAALRSGSFKKADGKSQDFTTLTPGTIIDTSQDTEYEFLEPKVQARDVAEDGRNFRLLIAAFFSMPEYVVTSDASNANFASTAVAEAPGTKAMEAWQEHVSAVVTDFVGWLLDEPDVEPKIGFPILINRDVDKEVGALSKEHMQGIISKETWREKRGYDQKQEEERAASEGTADMEDRELPSEGDIDGELLQPGQGETS